MADSSELQEKMQQKYMELQLLQHQMQQVQQQVQALDAQAQEMDVVQTAMDDFAKSKAGSGMFVTLTPGVFVKAKLEDSDHVLVNVGGGAVVQKTVEEGKGLIANQASELRKLNEELTEQLHAMAKRAEQVQGELQKLVE